MNWRLQEREEQIPGDQINVRCRGVIGNVATILILAGLFSFLTAWRAGESLGAPQAEGVHNITSRSMMMTAGEMYFVAIGDAKNADVTPAEQEKAESNAQYDFGSVPGIGSTGKLLIDGEDTWSFTGQIGLVIKARHTSRGWDADHSQIIYLPFNNGHSVSVTLLRGATATLAGRTVRAETTATFQLQDGSSAGLETAIQQGKVVEATASPSGAVPTGLSSESVGSTRWEGRSSNGEMWTSIEFETDGNLQTIGSIKIIIGEEEEGKPFLRAEIRDTAPIGPDGTFTIESDDLELTSLAAVSMTGLTWGDLQKPLISVVRGTLSASGTGDGSFETRFDQLSIQGGELLTPCLNWTATRVEILR